MDSKIKRMIIFVIGMAVVLTVIGTITYAFFSPLGETTTQEATISTGAARATFRDGDTGITGELAFGESLTKKFTIENTGTAEANVKMYWKDLVNTYTEGSLTYTLSEAETEDGPYTEVVSKTNVPISNRVTIEILANNLTIPVGKTYYYNLVITLNYLADLNQDEDITAKFSSSFDLKDVNYKDSTPSEKTLVALGKTSNGVRTNFDDPATTDEGIYEMEDDYGTSYYYRGAVEDNYVKYGVNKDGQEMWWRIIRINGDGSVRMVYDGTQGYANGTASDDRFIKTSQPFNAQYNDAKYVGWMYGPEGTASSTSKEQAQSNIADSDAKRIVDAWYKENIEDTGYGLNVSDSIFCNDRSFSSSNLGTGFGTSITYYGASGRMKMNITENTGAEPSFVCPQKNDAFTVDDTSNGNGDLIYPVGLITADEIVAAGSGKWRMSNQSYYLFRSGDYCQYSLSPYYYGDGGDHADIFVIYGNGNISYLYVNDIRGGISPVINLSSEYINSMIGTGTITDPYRAKET